MIVEINKPGLAGTYWWAEVGVSASYNAGQDAFLFYHPDLVAIDKWCEETFGKSDTWGSDPVNGWKRMRAGYYFTNPELFDMFVLRWN